MNRRLYRSENERILTGVCGGLAEHLDIDPTLVRILFIIFTLFYGIGIILYLALALLLPRESAVTDNSAQVIQDNAREMKERAKEIAHDVRESTRRSDTMDPEENAKENVMEQDNQNRQSHHGRWLAGIILIVMGLLFIGDNMGIFQWFNFHTLWPVILIIVGLYLILRRAES